MQHDKNIISIQGPAGGGKTTVSRALSKKLSGRTVNVSMDVLKNMTRLEVANQEEADKYILMAKESVVGLVKFYLEKEINNIIVEFSPPVDTDKGETDKKVVQELKKLGGKMFLLEVSLEEVIKRNKEREDVLGKWGGPSLSEDLVRKLYKNYKDFIDREDFVVIDTNKIDEEETALIILEKI